MYKKVVSLLIAASACFFASAQQTREVNGGVDFQNVYNMGAKTGYSHWSVEVHGGLNTINDRAGKYFKDNKWGSCIKSNPQVGAQVEYTFTQFWGIGADYTWALCNQENYDCVDNEISAFVSVNMANLLAPYRSWKKFQAYANFGVGDAVASWKNVTDLKGNKMEDNTVATHPFVWPGLNLEYIFDDNLSFGLNGQARVFLADPEMGKCFHPTNNGGNTQYQANISVRYKFAGNRNVRNSNPKRQVDYSLDLKDQLTMINRQARRLDSLSQATAEEIESLKSENMALKRTVKAQQDSIENISRRAALAEATIYNPTETESKLIKASLSDLRFETGKAIIMPESYPSLDNLANLISSHLEWNVMLSGHTDSYGNPEKNLKLSKDRAAAVKDYLVKKGIDERRVRSAGFGDKDPIAPNNTPEGRAKNRRVELELFTKSAE